MKGVEYVILFRGSTEWEKIVVLHTVSLTEHTHTKADIEQPFVSVHSVSTYTR